MKVIVLPADTYVVSNKAIISEYSRKIISMLYQPIIGSNATNLYFTLWSNLDINNVLSLEHSHHNLMSSMHLSIDEIVNAREKLEGIGLLRVYVSKGSVNQYVYELFSPLDANEFFSNPILNTALFNFIGKTEYEKITSYFSLPKINLKNYEEITSSFHEVYDFKASTSVEQNNSIVKNSKLGLTFKPTIDLDSVLSSIPEDMLELKKITKEIKDFLYKIAFVYNFNDDIMENIIRNSIDERHLIDKEKIRENCRKIYAYENSGKFPTIIYRNQPDYLKHEITDTSKRSQFIYTLESMSPYEFLTIKNHNVRPSKSDLSVLEMLLIDFELPPGVVNVLIDYVLKINNNKLIPQFVENIATQWKRSNIKTVEEAMSIATQEKKIKLNNNAKDNSQVKKKEETPDWFDKTIETSEVSNDQMQEFMQRLKEVK